MSFVIALPDALETTATDLASIGSTLSAAHTAAAAPTTGLPAAAEDEVSAAIASVFSTHGQEFQAVGARAAAFQAQFERVLTASAASYAGAEAANAAAFPPNPLQTVQQELLTAINAPFLAQTGRPLIGTGANGAPGTGQDGNPGGWLLGDGGAGGSGALG